MHRPLRRLGLLVSTMGITAASVLGTTQIALPDDPDDPVPSPPVVIPWYLSPSPVDRPSDTPSVVVSFEPISPLIVENGIEGHTDVDHRGSADLYLPADTTDRHNNLVLAKDNQAVVAIPNADGHATGDARNQCTSAVDNTPATLGISLSPEPFDESNPYHGGPGSWVCVRTNEHNLVLLRLDTVRQATSTDGSGAEVDFTVTNVWYSS